MRTLIRSNKGAYKSATILLLLFIALLIYYSQDLCVSGRVHSNTTVMKLGAVVVVAWKIMLLYNVNSVSR